MGLALSTAIDPLTVMRLLGFASVYKGRVGFVEGTTEGYVEVLDVSDRVITYHVDYEGTIDGWSFSAKGEFGVTRCH